MRNLELINFKDNFEKSLLFPSIEISPDHHFYKNRMGEVRSVYGFDTDGYPTVSSLTKGGIRRSVRALSSLTLFLESGSRSAYHKNGSASIDSNVISPFDLIERITKEEAYHGDPYSHVPFDLERDNKYDRDGLMPYVYSVGLPHSFRELNLILRGLKPFAVVLNTPEFFDICKKHGLYHEVTEKNVLLVSGPGEEWRLHLYKMRSGQSVKLDEDTIHRINGGLFGYSSYEVENYLTKRKFIKEFYLSETWK